MVIILTTRFNNNTWKENYTYRLKKNITCIYPVPNKITSNIEPLSLVFVIEMNNTTNKIQGIGLIRNKLNLEYQYNVYQENNYNRYCYIGKYYMDREQLMEYDNELIKILEMVLFKGKTHLKRGIGFTMLSEKILKRWNICLEEFKKKIIKIFSEWKMRL